LVLLTPESIHKTWINQEMDAGLVRKIESQTRFITLRSNLPSSELPPLLKGIYSPSLEDFDQSMIQLINDIHGISRKPPLGRPPLSSLATNPGYSAAATAIARIFAEGTAHGLSGDPLLTVGQLCSLTALSEEDVADGLHELGEMIEVEHDTVFVTQELFVTFDKCFRGWDPVADALTLAADMVNDNSFPGEPEHIAERYQWEPHRLNSAIGYLRGRKLIQVLTCLGMRQWSASHIEKTDSTRRFVKSRC
jgi:hypothetical protein